MSEKCTASLAALDIGRDKRASDMIKQIEPVRNRDDVVLSAENLKLFTGLVEEFRSGDTLCAHGMPLRSKLLFCGPPGCG